AGSTGTAITQRPDVRLAGQRGPGGEMRKGAGPRGSAPFWSCRPLAGNCTVEIHRAAGQRPALPEQRSSKGQMCGWQANAAPAAK
ncbi:hypothetical protein LRM36_19935, partial [Stenotrophomonas maltophilia]|nr:hypothetical protein [Stenotrophomonas maltophilia]